MVLVAAKDWTANSPVLGQDGDAEEATSAGILEILMGRKAMEQVKDELMESVQLAVTVLPDMLADTSDNLKHPKLRRPAEVRAAMKLEGADDLYKELAQATRSFPSEKEELTNDIRVRLTIVVRSLQNVAMLLGRIEE